MKRSVKITAITAALIMVLSLGLIGCGTAVGSGGTRTDATGTNMSDSSGFVYDPSEDVIGTSDDEYVLTDSEQQLTALVENVADTVVEITTSQVTTGSWMQQYVTEGAGSGVVITSTGIIITNNHVIEGADTIQVTMRDGSEYAATLIATDEMYDIAVIKIEATGLKAATFGDSDDLKVGQTAVAIGNPLGSLGGTVTEGIISATGRQIYVEGIPMTLLQTTAAINPGNSGGGLFNLAGELIGVVNAKMSEEGIEGLGFAIPSNTALAAATDLLTQGYVTGRPDVGFTVMEITDMKTALQYGVLYSGVYVMQLGANAPESVKTLDCIVSVNGQSVADADDFKSALYSSSVGDTLTVTFLRKEQTTSSGSGAQGGGYTKVEAEIPVIQYNPADYAS